MSDTVFQVPDRAVYAVRGADVRDFLDRVATGPIPAAGSGAATYGALLTPQGKIITTFYLHDAGDDGLHLDVHAPAADALIKRLSLFKLKADVAFERASEDMRVFRRFTGAEGSSAVGVEGETRWLAAPGTGIDDPDAYTRARIEHGFPAFGVDYTDSEHFPSDVNLDLLAGVDYAKGCFIGQEVVSRMKRRGTIRKRVVRAHVDGPGAVSPGRPVTAGPATLGTLMSVQDDAALAVVRLDRWVAAGDAPIVSDGVALTLSFPDWFPDDARTLEPAS